MCSEIATGKRGLELTLSIDWASPEGLVLRGVHHRLDDRADDGVRDEHHAAPLSLRALLEAIPAGHPLRALVLVAHRSAITEARRMIGLHGQVIEEERDRHHRLVVQLGETQILA